MQSVTELHQRLPVGNMAEMPCIDSIHSSMLVGCVDSVLEYMQTCSSYNEQ